MTLSAAFVLALSAEVTDPAGHHFKAGVLALDGATTIASVCEVQTVLPKETCAALLVVMAARESGFNNSAIGDGGKARGMYQLHVFELGMQPPKTLSEATTQYFPWLLKSFKACPDFPLAPLAGSCRHPLARQISTSRIEEAKRILLVVKASKPEGGST